jgi:hypothetical protein
MFPLGHPHLVMEIVVIINEPKVKSRSPMTIGSLDPIKTLNQLAQLSNSLLYIQKHLILLILLKLLQYRVLTITISPNINAIANNIISFPSSKFSCLFSDSIISYGMPDSFRNFCAETIEALSYCQYELSHWSTLIKPSYWVLRYSMNRRNTRKKKIFRSLERALGC